MLKAVIICHQASRREEPEPVSKSLFKSIYAEEESHLMLAHSYDFRFLDRQHKSIMIGVENEARIKLDIMVTHCF